MHATAKNLSPEETWASVIGKKSGKINAVENLVKDKVVVAQDSLQFTSLDETSYQQRVARH